jgi:hypothetical protein
VSKRLGLNKRKEFEFEIQTLQYLEYTVSYRSNTVATIVSRPSPITKISPRDLEGVVALTETMNNRTFPHYGKMKSGWRERRKSSLS